MELEKGMYVRTETGQIGKITNFDGSMARVDTDKFITYKNFNSEITKASHNIIDLIEEHDYIRIITSAYFEPVYYSYGKLVIRDDIDISKYTNKFIAEVITHEQIESMSYKVGE